MAVGLEAAEPAEQWRARFGLLFLVLGVGLLVIAWASWAYRISDRDETEIVAGQPSIPSEPSPRQVTTIQAAQWLLMWSALLLLAVIMGTYAVVRGARRFRQLADHKRAPPTPLEDIWSQHRAPRLDDEDET